MSHDRSQHLDDAEWPRPVDDMRPLQLGVGVLEVRRKEWADREDVLERLGVPRHVEVHPSTPNARRDPLVQDIVAHPDVGHVEVHLHLKVCHRPLALVVSCTEPSRLPQMHG